MGEHVGQVWNLPPFGRFQTCPTRQGMSGESRRASYSSRKLLSFLRGALVKGPDWSDDYWPEGVLHEESLPAFLMAFATVGYEPCADGGLEPGVEKVAIYAHEGGAVRHAARQQPDGTWRSKLGEDEGIEHTLNGLVGPFYGRIVAYLKRPRQSPGPTKHDGRGEPGTDFGLRKQPGI